MYAEQLTQRLSPQDIASYYALTNTTVSTNGINLAKFARAIYYILPVNVGAAGVIAATLQSCKYAAFNSAVHNVANCTITNLTANNTVTSVEVRGDQITYQNPGDQYIRLNLTGSGNPVAVAVLGDGGDSMQGPAQQYNNTTIVNTVVCST